VPATVPVLRQRAQPGRGVAVAMATASRIETSEASMGERILGAESTRK
jgi:hypothetical protein